MKEKVQPDNPLVNDLHRVLGYEVRFPGTFAVSMVIPGCPNPGLDVDGVGRIPLPLTCQTAELLASVGHQAPYGRGADTVVDTTVRDTIQIDASNIRFVNPKWTPAIQNWVKEEVWSGLGCAPFTSPPKCELYKLLLYKPGAHFLPHKDTEKAPGMFASLVVVLPSEFTGGEIHVSHGDKSMVFDNAKDSAFETTSLAWYTDVTHEVKEITSGYRLALSYHLINTSPGITPPPLPSDDSSLQHLREIFSRWSNNEYPALKVNPVVAYAFTHEYSDVSLQEAIFKGGDQHMASILKQAGDMEGVFVLMGWLKVHVEGCTSDDGWQTFDDYYGSAPEYGLDTGTRDFPVMTHVFETKFWVKDLRDLQGKRTAITKIDLGDGSILPYRAFRGVGPDESKLHEGYWGNEGATVEFMYRCAALVMFPKAEQLSLIMSSEGHTWALEELERSKSDGPSKENREIIDLLVQKKYEDVAATISKIAIEWNDATVWDRIVESDPGYFLEQEEYADLCDGWDALGFGGVRPTFEKLFRESKSLERAGMQFLLFVKEKLPFGKDPEKDEWISAQAIRVMESFSAGGAAISGTIKTSVMGIVRWKGLYFASSVVLPRFLQKHVRLEALTEFALELVKHKEELIALPETEGHTASNAELLDHILDKILEAAISEVPGRDQYGRRSAVSSLLSICIPGNRMGAYGDLLGSFALGPHKEYFYSEYQYFYAEIIPDLVKLLREHGVDVSSSPSREFFYDIIGTYLEQILGSKKGSPYLKFSVLTCEHEGCAQINDFLRSKKTHMTIKTDWGAISDCVASLKIDGKRYEYPLLQVRGQSTATRLQTVEFIKNHEAEAAQDWSVRLADARKMLKDIGTDEEISQIMGERHSDVEKALEGSQAFVTSETGKGFEKEDAMTGIEDS